MVKHGDTQNTLAKDMGINISTLNAKINNYRNYCFNQAEIAYIKNRYNLSARDVNNIFFANVVSCRDTHSDNKKTG